ncbi:beta-ketoacyl synthase N-terminal-like domain-containing protein [Natronoglycomyces albus]|uniref:Beta-ketoacyl synthase chain length factor n=1 Tax=Natronoglycomyces albus TaxID=2811108 RepID=A0A895XT89_9ACTN|nr:beta-ketoacyl synthase N-terminal-like domain-containing protein [Natronoglycomyces albus]QSB06495.1 beta-ketoacyl synthase chain length factor [Natronoglycomyces albus]
MNSTVYLNRVVVTHPNDEASTTTQRPIWDTATKLAVETLTRLLADAPLSENDTTGIIVATRHGGLASVLNFTSQTFTRPKPYQVPPAHFPGTLLNYIAGQCTIVHKVTGPAFTLGAGTASLAQSLSLARTLLTSGRATRVLCGAVEETSAWREAVEQPLARRRRPPQGAGCVMLDLSRSPGLALIRSESTALCDCDPTAALEEVRNSLGPSLPTTLIDPYGLAGNGNRDQGTNLTDTASALPFFALISQLERTGPSLLLGLDDTGIAWGVCTDRSEP